VTRGDKWRFTGIYGEVRTEFKYKTWDLLVQNMGSAGCAPLRNY
jgi:hypothetical protein